MHMSLLFGREEIETLIKHHKFELEREKRYLWLAFVGLTKESPDDKKKKVEYSIDELKFRIEMRELRIKELNKKLETGD